MKTLGICLALIAFPRLRWSFVYLAWIHICMVVAMLKFASIWHRSTLYSWYLCPSLSPLSHGSTLYSSSHACLFLPWIYLVLVCNHELVTCVYESTYWCTTYAYLKTCSDRANIFISWKWLVLKALIYCVTLRLMLWGASCYTKILSPP